MLRKKLGVIVATLMMLAVMAASPALAVPGNEALPPEHSCGVGDAPAYVAEDTRPGASEITQPGFKPLEYGCAPGKVEDPRPQ